MFFLLPAYSSGTVGRKLDSPGEMQIEVIGKRYFRGPETRILSDKLLEEWHWTWQVITRPSAELSLRGLVTNGTVSLH